MAGRQGCRVRESRKITKNKVNSRCEFECEDMPCIVAYVILHTFTVEYLTALIDRRHQGIHDGILFRSPIAEVTLCHAESAILQRVPTLTLVFV